MKTAFYFTLLFITSVLIIIGCNKDKFDFERVKQLEYNPSLALPLINSTITVDNILNITDSLADVGVNPNSKIVEIIYSSELFSFDGSEFLEIRDTSKTEVMALEALEVAAFLVDDSVKVDTSATFEFATPKEYSVDSIRLKGGDLDFRIQTDIQHSGRFDILLPAVVKDGKAFQASIPFSYNGSPTDEASNFDLNGYTVDLTSTGGSNSIPVYYSVTLFNNGNPINAGEEFTITQTYGGMSFSSVFGYFGKEAIDMPKDTIDIKLFNNEFGGYFELSNPKITFNINNSFGFPTNINFEDLKTIEKESKIEYPLQGFPNPIEINYPKVSEIGSSSFSEIVLDKDNTTNMSTVINSISKILVYDVEAISNPDGNPPAGETNFITDTSKLKIDAEIILPFEGLMRNLALNDTSNIDFDDIEEVESILLRININNGFPFESNTQIYTTDSNFVITDSLFNGTEIIMPAGATNANGRVISSTTKTTDILIEGRIAESLINASHLITQNRFSTYDATNGQVIKIFEDYSMTIKVGAKINAKLKVDVL